MTQHIHWYEGLFLQPHHLQLMQNNLLENGRQERRLAWAYPYGVVEAEFSEDALRNYLIQFNQLRCIMPSGVEVDYPLSADLPPLNIQKAFDEVSEAITVLLAVPLYDANGANTISNETSDAWKSRRVYRLAEIERPDENTGVHSHPIMVRRVNARLLLEGSDTSGLEIIPLLRIMRSTAESGGMPALDKGFVPPCLLVKGYPLLRAILKDLANQVDANRRDLVTRMARGSAKAESSAESQKQVEQMMFLGTLNRFSNRLVHLNLAPNVAPFELYRELTDLLGELATLVPGYDVTQVPYYDHERPGPVFEDLSKRIRTLLNQIASQRYRKIEFAEEGDAFFADISGYDVAGAVACYIAIETEEDPRNLMRLVENQDRFKVMAKSNVQLRVRGLTLREEREVPMDLPAQSGLYYFRIMPDDNRALWRRILVENTMAIRFTGVESPDYKFALYLTYSEME